MLSTLIFVPVILELLRDCVDQMLPYVPNFSSNNSRINLRRGISFLYTELYNRQEFTTETFSKQAKKGHHHFFDLIFTREFVINWSNKSTPYIRPS